MHPHRIYYGDLLSREEFLKLPKELKGEYLRFLNIAFLGDVQRIALVINGEIGETFSLMYEFELAPEGEVLEPDAHIMFHRAVKAMEEPLLEKLLVNTRLIVSVERIMAKAATISPKCNRGVFDKAYSEVVGREIKSINNSFSNYREDDEVKAKLKAFKLEQDEKIRGGHIVNSLSNREVRMMLNEMEAGIDPWTDDGDDDILVAGTNFEEIEELVKMTIVGKRYPSLTAEELKNYTYIEDIIHKSPEEMDEGDVQEVALECPIEPVRNWRLVSNQTEYLRQLRLYFPHVTNTKMVRDLFKGTVSLSTLGDKFIGLKVKVDTVPPARARRYELENKAFDEWIALYEETPTNVAVSTKEGANENTDNCGGETLANPDAVVESASTPEAASTPESASEPEMAVNPEPASKPEMASVPELMVTNTTRYCMAVEIEGDDPAKLYELFADILRHYGNDRRGKVQLNPTIFDD